MLLHDTCYLFLTSQWPLFELLIKSAPRLLQIVKFHTHSKVCFYLYILSFHLCNSSLPFPVHLAQFFFDTAQSGGHIGLGQSRYFRNFFVTFIFKIKQDKRFLHMVEAGNEIV